MEKKEIRSGCVLVGLFMDASFWGTKLSHWNELNKIPPMKYHESWDWLIPACKKFKNLSRENKIPFGSVEEFYKQVDSLDANVTFYDIIPAFKSLVEKIKWYNKLNHQPPTT